MCVIQGPAGEARCGKRNSERRNDVQALQIAREYFELSNQADLDTIEALFLPTSTYSSSQGLFFGPPDIMAMMRGFFASHISLHWTIDSARELTPHIVEIEFSFQGRDPKGNNILRRGLERVVVRGGRIHHIEVRPLDSN